MADRSSHLLVIGEREALAWILRERRIAFPAGRGPTTKDLVAGDELFLVTTRGCYHNPARDRTLVIGIASAISNAEELTRPVEVAGRSFPWGCDIELTSLAPRGRGVEMARMVDDLDVFPKKHAWAATLRRAVVTLPPGDAPLLRRGLTDEAGGLLPSIASYLETIRPVAVST